MTGEDCAWYGTEMLGWNLCYGSCIWVGLLIECIGSVQALCGSEQ